MLQDWPVVCRGLLSYPTQEVGGDGQPVEIWRNKHIGCINMIASNVPMLGVDHPICKGAAASVIMSLGRHRYK